VFPVVAADELQALVPGSAIASSSGLAGSTTMKRSLFNLAFNGDLAAVHSTMRRTGPVPDLFPHIGGKVGCPTEQMAEKTRQIFLQMPTPVSHTVIFTTS
jgi:hypothetical protein